MPIANSESILIVDDEQLVAETLKEGLERQGHRCLIAGTGAEALRCLRSTTVALVLLDLGLPDMNGIEVMRAALRQGSDPDILIMTGQASADSAMEAVEGDTVGYILKPIQLPRLAGIVRRVLERRRLAGENARLQFEMNQRLKETEAVLAISKASSSTLESQEALRRICRELTRLIGADTGAVYLHDAGSNQIVPLAGYKVPPDLLPTLLATPLPLQEQGFHAAIWSQRRPVMSDDVAADPRFSHELFRRFKHQSGLVLPLIMDNEVAGAFYLVWWRERRRLSERELGLLESVAAQATGLLRNIRLFEQAERERRRLDVLYEVSRRLAAARDGKSVLARLVDEAMNLLGVEAAGIRLLEGDDLVVAARTLSAAPVMVAPRIKVGESLSGRVVATGEPVLVTNLPADETFHPDDRQGAREHGFQTFLGVPLRLHDKVIGELNVYTKRHREFAPDEISLLSALADQAALAIHKARLLADAQAREREATQLHEVTSLLASSLDADWILDQICARAVELLHCDAFGVHMPDPARGGLTLRREINLPAELKDNLVLKPGEGLVGRAMESRKPAWTRDCLSDPSLSYAQGVDDLIRRQSPRAYLAVPIIVRGEILGVLMSYFFEPHDFSENEVRLLGTLADHAGIAIDNARHYEQERQISQMKSDFVGFVTHQLRTPLAGIKWMLELASQEADLPAEAASYVQDAQAAAQRLIGLVNDLLDIGRLERGKLSIAPQPVALGALTQSVLEETRVLVEGKGHRLDMTAVAEGPVVAADSQLLRQVVLNLVSNAIKYTPDGGKIEIEMGQADGLGRWQIRDSGLGVPREAQGRLFEKFYRADNVTSMETEGTGLGLYLVRLIMEQLGGRVWCESVEGEGATFAFTLPLHAETA